MGNESKPKVPTTTSPRPGEAMGANLRNQGLADRFATPTNDPEELAARADLLNKLPAADRGHLLGVVTKIQVGEQLQENAAADAAEAAAAKAPAETADPDAAHNVTETG